MIKTADFHCKGWVWVRSLVRELRSHMLCSMAKKKKNNTRTWMRKSNLPRLKERQVRT